MRILISMCRCPRWCGPLGEYQAEELVLIECQGGNHGFGGCKCLELNVFGRAYGIEVEGEIPGASELVLDGKVR